ncbi:MAG: hypothetical protein K5867_07685 [Bacteroidales bacterium]|nr:hypothetical protein [Bacteroidales bacterium]
MKQFDTFTDGLPNDDDCKPTYIEKQYNNNCQQFYGPISNSTFIMPTASPMTKDVSNNTTQKSESGISTSLELADREDSNCGIPTGAQAEENEIVNKYDHFVKTVEAYRFLECPAVACLDEAQRGQLVRKIVSRSDKNGAYAIAMLCELNYDNWMMENYAKANPHCKKMTKTAIFNHWTDALSLTSTRAVAGNYNVIRNTNSCEDRDKYKASEYTLAVHKDYLAIKNTGKKLG